MKNSNKSFFKIVDGKSVPFNPVDINGNPIKFKDSVIMPDPEGDDNWNHGGFSVTVVDVIEMHTTGPDSVEMLTVEDSDGDFFNVEPNRVELSEENDDEEVTRLKDEKNGLYPDRIDIAN